MATAREEFIGSVTTILRPVAENHPLKLASNTDNGLTSAVYSSGLDQGIRLTLGSEGDTTNVNDGSAHDAPHVPFGGEKQSSVGRFGGRWIIDQVTTEHIVSVQRESRSCRP